MTLTEIKRFRAKVSALLKETIDFKNDNILLTSVKDRLEKNEKLYEEQLDETCNNLLAKGSLKVLKAYSNKCKRKAKEDE